MFIAAAAGAACGEPHCADTSTCKPPSPSSTGAGGSGGSVSNTGGSVASTGGAGGGPSAGGSGATSGMGGAGGDGPPFVVRLEGGQHHTCAQLSTGDAWCWGSNGDGRLGNGTGMPSNVPVRVENLPTASSFVSAGWQHTCAVAAGDVWCWGGDLQGELGNDDPGTGSIMPVQAMGISGITEVSGGVYGTCARSGGGTVHCWGSNQVGALGTGSLMGPSSPVPVQVLNIADAAQIARGGFHACALTMADQIWCWGSNGSGQLGDGNLMFNSGSAVPVRVLNISSVAEVAGGLDFTCARLNNGTVWCWGLNSSGQLGNNGMGTTSDVPVQVQGIGTAVSIATGGNHACAALANGQVWCWGSNGSGQLGDGNTMTSEDLPVQAMGVTNAHSVAVGTVHSCALTDDQRTFCWGLNDSGQLGNASNQPSPTPTEVQSLWFAD